mgnify:CR=1 FL=1
MTNRHLRRVVNLVKQGKGSCIVCGHAVQPKDFEKAIVTLLDNRVASIVHNMTLRHGHCTRSAYRPVVSPDNIVKLVEAMIEAEYKLCPICRKSWVLCEIEELVLVERRETKDVAHLVCVAPSVR